jgi:hypothetical protein
VVFLKLILSRKKLGNRETGTADQAAERSLGDLAMVRDREACDLVVFDENYVASSLTSNDPAEAFEDLDDFPTAEDGQAGHSGHHFDFASLDGQGQAPLGANLQAERDGFFNVLERLLLGVSLADAPRNGGAFDYPHAIFIAVQSHLKAHRLSL